MTTRAREVLTDCEHALADFEAAPNSPFQRPRGVAVMTLLRTVGLVLKNVDGPNGSEKFRRLIDDHWKRLNSRKPEPRIFHQFIDEERYNVVHLYDPAARVNITIRVGGVATGGISDPPGPTTFEFVMKKGSFQGREPSELCREAMMFWKNYLDEIDRDAAVTPSVTTDQ